MFEDEDGKEKMCMRRRRSGLEKTKGGCEKERKRKGRSRKRETQRENAG